MLYIHIYLIGSFTSPDAMRCFQLRKFGRNMWRNFRKERKKISKNLVMEMSEAM